MYDPRVERSAFTDLWRTPAVREQLERVEADREQVVEEAIAIQSVPAPTFSEAARAVFVHEKLAALGVGELGVDEQGNVLGCIPGRERGPALLLSAHLDTVFDMDTPLATRRTSDRLYGPGIGDNSMGVAGLLAMARALLAMPPRRDVWLAANVGEEGLGNLQGMWQVTRRLASRLGAVVVVEGGAYGHIIHKGIGVQRRRLVVQTEGGHAWGDFGTPSAIHELCRIGARLAAMEVPAEPRSSFNLGTIEGGTRINTIASHASALLDLRSESPTALEDLGARVGAILQDARGPAVRVESEEIGARPAGGIPAEHPLVQLAVASYSWGARGRARPELLAASTDANVPLALGIPSVCVGITRGHNAHRNDEYIELEPIARGLHHLFLLLWTTAERLL